MSNPYISKQTLLEQRSNIEKDLLQSFSNRVQETISEALQSLLTNLKDSLEIEINLSLEELSYNLYSSILQDHCELLEELGYETFIYKISLDEGRAIIRLKLTDE